MLYAQIHLTLPSWVHEEVDAEKLYPDAASRIALAIDLSRLNVQHRSGGPSAPRCSAATAACSAWASTAWCRRSARPRTAEVLALATSQQRTQAYRLNVGGSRITLAASSQPCAMCFGACCGPASTNC
jgi:hypothetical protein